MVLDTADWAQNLAIDYITKKDYGGDLDKFNSYGAGYKVLKQEWLRLLMYLERLRETKKMEIIILSHAITKTFKNPSGDDWDKYQSNLIDTPATSIWALTKQWADVVVFMNLKVSVRKNNIKEAKGKGILCGDTRLCYTAPSASYDAKVRAGWDLPDQFPLCQKEFRKLLK